MMTNEERRMFYQMLMALEKLTKAVETLSETMKGNNNENSKSE